MKIREPLFFKGRAEIVVRGPNGRFKQRRVVNNVVVGAGVNAIMQVAAPVALATAFRYFELGSNSTPAANTDTGLGTAIASTIVGPITPTYAYANPTATLSYSYTWGAGTLGGAYPYSIYEFGLFTAAAAVMWNHLVFGLVTVASADTLTINLTVQAT